jgi:hypothetical protein
MVESIARLEGGIAIVCDGGLSCVRGNTADDVSREPEGKPCSPSPLMSAVR